MSRSEGIRNEDVTGKSGLDDDGLDFVDAAFDADLAAMFDAAGPAQPDPAFTEQVMSKAGRSARYRFFALGGAGLLGAAFAGAQLPKLLDIAGAEAGALLGRAAGFAGPETAVTLIFAAIALGFSRVLAGDRTV